VHWHRLRQRRQHAWDAVQQRRKHLVLRLHDGGKRLGVRGRLDEHWVNGGHVPRSSLGSQRVSDGAQRAEPHATVQQMAQAVRVIRSLRHGHAQLMQGRPRPPEVPHDQRVGVQRHAACEQRV
jgi:hypothetical protein